ncbi:16S rRNA (uracil(1498)-N(3))-methyltransferase [Deefgea piscis]|uniref:Ribosomal RNA small subunit methyltransferase E n=1 Tax=Deefgea piscis TaxID=2739061 RepID=A0A6M8SMX7_9NEIS|nr:16S rRNA (uracil(1498)-N(3))-methyltransferase [Deefgea piscis]QKJ66495.1 16S rRNA (uracil(1498)-N(3))-methyltransferase [Deefgea piscis]
MPRFYIDLPLSIGQSFDLPESVARHVQVLRLQPSEEIILFNGQGGEFTAQIAAMGKKTVSVDVLSFADVDRESPLKITLVQAISAADRMDYTVQKAAELGVAVLQPVISQYCQQRYSGERAEKRLAHWQAIAASAAEQCGRTRLLEIRPILTLAQFLAQPNAGELKLLLCPTGAVAWASLPEKVASVCVLIGPEGGYSSEEDDLAIAAGYTSVLLGPRILRTESVAPVIAGLLQSRYGDF